MVLLVWPMSSSFLSTRPTLSSSCFMPASLTPQSLPPRSPTMASYFGDSTVVTCMRAGLYQTKNGLLVRLGSLRSRKSMTLAEISSSTVFERSSVNGPASLHIVFFPVPSADLQDSMFRGVVGHEDRAFIPDPVDVRCFADHQAAVVDARLHPADVVAHDEEDVGLCLLLRGSRRARHRHGSEQREQAEA